MPTDVPALTADDQVARIFALRRGFNTIHLIDVGIKLGVFRALAETPGQSVDALAERLDLRASWLKTWLWTAHGESLVDADDHERFRLAPYLDAILANPSHPRYLGGYVQLGTDFATEDFRRSVAGYRDGTVKPFQGRGEDFAKVIAESTWGLQVATAKKILPGMAGLPERLAAGGAILEVGCGTANFLVQAARAFPMARAIGVDIDPDGLAVGRVRVADAGLSDRIELRAGTVGATVSAGSVDAVVMIEVLHEISRSLRASVVAECAAALKPGGWLVIVDETYPSTLAQTREAGYRFPLQTAIEELTWGNEIPTREEQESLLRGAGFTGPIGRSLIGEGFTILSVQA